MLISNHNSFRELFECLITFLPYILFEKYIHILALEMASPENQHCINCIGTLSFAIVTVHIDAINQGQRSCGSTVRVETDGRTRPIALPSPLTRLARSGPVIHTAGQGLTGDRRGKCQPTSHCGPVWHSTTTSTNTNTNTTSSSSSSRCRMFPSEVSSGAEMTRSTPHDATAGKYQFSRE